MSNLITSGFTFALLSSDFHSKSAAQPMNMASKELKMKEPDRELIDRAMSYGTQELRVASDACDSAQEELKKAQEIARIEKKAEDTTKLEERQQERKLETEKLRDVPSEKSNVSVNNISTSENEDLNTVKDTVEISQEAQLQSATNGVAKIVTNPPQIYSANMVATEMNSSFTTSQVNVFV